MNVEFIEPASIELDDAVKYYNLESPGLEDEFFAEVLKTIELIKIFPEVWSEITKNTRKAVLRKFPYNLVYTKYNNKIYILAVAHQHRVPEYWIDRVID